MTQTRNLIDTATAMTITGWGATTLHRRVKDGTIQSFPDPRDKRRTLFDADELTSVVSPGHIPAARADLHDLATLRFSQVLAEYEEGNLEGFREKVRATPANLIPHMLEIAMILSFNALEDNVANATPEQVEAAREALADEL